MWEECDARSRFHEPSRSSDGISSLSYLRDDESVIEIPPDILSSRDGDIRPDNHVRTPEPKENAIYVFESHIARFRG